MVSEKVPGDTDDVVARNSVEEPAPVIEAGLKLAEAPDGSPVTLNAMLPANPLTAVVERE
jgi:hypothetical protein